MFASESLVAKASTICTQTRTPASPENIHPAVLRNRSVHVEGSGTHWAFPLPLHTHQRITCTNRLLPFLAPRVEISGPVIALILNHYKPKRQAFQQLWQYGNSRNFNSRWLSNRKSRTIAASYCERMRNMRSVQRTAGHWIGALIKSGEKFAPFVNSNLDIPPHYPGRTGQAALRFSRLVSIRHLELGDMVAFGWQMPWRRNSFRNLECITFQRR
jgi:hypothetical protein